MCDLPQICIAGQPATRLTARLHELISGDVGTEDLLHARTRAV